MGKKITNSVIGGALGGAIGFAIPHLLKTNKTVKIVSAIVLAASGFALAYFTTSPSSLDVSIDKGDKEERRLLFIKKK